MKKINRKFIRGTNWALAGLMSFFGFSSCDRFGAAEYGTPHAEYIVSGKVTDSEGKALTGINVVAISEENCYIGRPDLYQKYDISEGYSKNRITNSKGEFVYPYTGWRSADTVKMKMRFDDKENKAYESDTAIVVFLKSELKGGKGWSEGKIEKKVSITMKKK